MAIYSDVTRESVLAAVRECDEKGRDQFLADHGYRRAKSYFLVVDGREYDSKAILGVACGYQHPDAEPLPYNAFPGGKNTVAKHLRSLGFEVRVDSEDVPLARVQTLRTLGNSVKRVKNSARYGDEGGESEETIARHLIEHAEELYKRTSGRVNFTGHTDADDLLNDITGYPHAFVTAAVMDRQIPAEKAWIIPHKIRERHGTFAFDSLAGLSEDDCLHLFQHPGKLHRFNDSMASLFYEAIQRIADVYAGDATRIWSDNPSSALLVGRFLEFKGVGPKIATMATNILVRDFKVPVQDHISIDVSPDVQVRRVFARLGFVQDGASNDELIYKARELNPLFPGIIDLPVWEIGREWCRPANPDCDSCFMHPVCPQIGIA